MKVVIFGNGKFASLAWYCLTHDSSYDVAGFTVDAPYVGDGTLHGLPVVDFASLEAVFPPESYQLLLHIGGGDMNALRIARFNTARTMGYTLARYISSRAIVWPDLHIGDNTTIYEGAIVQPFAIIGDNVIVRSGVHISHHVGIADHCFIAAGACFGGGASVGTSSFIGLNATIRDGVRIAEHCLIGAGAVVAADTQPNGVYVGVPARRVSTLEHQVVDS